MLVAALLCAAGPIAHAGPDISFEQHGRAQIVVEAERVPNDDIRRATDGRHRQDARVDLRWQGRASGEQLRAEVDVQLLGDFGSAVADLHAARQDGDTDAPRAGDLAAVLTRGGDRRTRARIDRLVLGYRGERAALSIGRQALSWGNGLVFAPMDLLAPFSPTATDRDFKPGDDMALAQVEFGEGRDVQLVYVTRRDDEGERSSDGASAGARLQAPVGDAELSLLLARHAGDDVLGAGASLPVFDGVLRTDWVLTRRNDGGLATSFVVNADRSFVIAERNVYAFVEAYRNGVGNGETPHALATLRAPLRTRLARGEVFTTSRWYGAAGVTIEWHSLVTQQLLAIVSVQDGSQLLQSNVRYEPDDRQRLEFTVLWQRGDDGDEFGGLPVGVPPRPTDTLGGGLRASVRYAVYW